MDKKPLYKDEKIEIDYLEKSIEDHFVTILKDETGFVIPRGALKEFSRTKPGKLEQRIYNLNPTALYQLKENNIGIDYLHTAICQAHIEEEQRYQDFKLEPLDKK